MTNLFRGTLRRARFLTSACLLALWSTSPAIATSVKPMSMREIADHSAQVCWATVESTTSRWSKGHRAIETVIHLRDVQYLKGSGEREFDWVVPGGSIDGFTMRLAGAPVFAVGERWMLCLLPEWKTHPCAGIWQGAFRAEQGATETVVRSADGMVSGLHPDSFVRCAMSSTKHTCFEDACKGAHVPVVSHTTPEPSITVEEWNALLQPILDASASHTQPKGSVVGTRIITTQRAVPFQNAAHEPSHRPAARAKDNALRPKVRLIEVGGSR